MPLYEYECDACHHRFELIRKFSDPPVLECPACGGTVQKLVSSPAIQFKGTGWYITDYARKGGKDGAKAEGKADSSKPAASGADAAKESGAKADAAPAGGATESGSSKTAGTATETKS